MIQLSRTRTEAAIPSSFRGKGLTKSSRALIVLQMANKEPASGVWKVAKPALKLDSHGKCAYCEAPTSDVAHGDVEHFRPKNVYWWLAYSLENYTFSCQICNQSYKGQNFPFSGPDLVAPVVPAGGDEAGLTALAATLSPDPMLITVVAAHQASMAKQKAHLPDPYSTDPEPLFAWSVDATNKEVKIRARTTKVASTRAYAAARDYLGLNRDELSRIRYEIYEGAEAFARILRIATLPQAAHDIAAAQLRSMMEPSSQFAGMIRYFVKDQWALTL